MTDKLHPKTGLTHFSAKLHGLSLIWKNTQNFICTPNAHTCHHHLRVERKELWLEALLLNKLILYHESEPNNYSWQHFIQSSWEKRGFCTFLKLLDFQAKLSINIKLENRTPYELLSTHGYVSNWYQVPQKCHQ